MTIAESPDKGATGDTVDWFEANKQDLAARVAVIAARLRRHALPAVDREGSDGELRAAEHRAASATEAMSGGAAIDRIVAAFGLSSFERDVLLLCAGVELDSAFATRCAEAQGDPHRPFPTFGLALAILPNPHWSAIVPGAPLRWWRLIELTTADGLTTAALRIDERVLHHLAGVTHVDERLQGLVTPIHDHDEMTPAQDELAQRVAAIWSGTKAGVDNPVIQLWGEDRANATAVAAHACHLLGIQLHRLDAADINPGVADRETLVRLWEREAILSSSALVVDVAEIEAPDMATNVRAATSVIDHLRGMVAVTAREPLSGGIRPTVRLHVARHSVDERRAVWTTTLGKAALTMNGRIDAVAAQFDLGIRGIRAAGAETLGRVAPAGNDAPEDDLAEALWQSCRSQARTRLDGLAERIETSSSWHDLVLPDPQGHALLEIAVQVRHRMKVYETWGFARKSRRGLGIGALFAGPSGTGKTMAAEVLANELRLDLYRIDLSQVVSKYIGETEKNLRRVFDAAEEGGSILVFDEADALFGKRSEVKDSHDRYANIEVSYLLQRMEAYRGLAILTTNMKSSIDGAFLRRLRFVVQFPFPDQGQRVEIWRRIFPDETPVEGLDFDGLARLNVAGGNIRNIALNAAFLAAQAETPVRMAYLLRAARSEYVKLEKPLTDAEVRGWA